MLPLYILITSWLPVSSINSRLQGRVKQDDTVCLLFTSVTIERLLYPRIIPLDPEETLRTEQLQTTAPDKSNTCSCIIQT